jgi:hypothetical protein
MNVKDFFNNRGKAIFFLTLVIEAITLLFRFGLGLESTKHTASTVGRLTFGIRIHHGYIGLLLLLIQLLPQLKNHWSRNIISVTGASLFISDIIHHLILYLLTGSADLDIFYPNS